MQPLSQVFGGAKQTPRAVFDQSRTVNAGAVANHRANDLAMACPGCRTEGNPSVRMFAKADVGYYCMTGKHKWKDFDELMALGPDKLEYKGITARQDGWQKLTVEMPGGVLEDLQKKYGDRLSATLRGVMDIISQPRYLMIPEEDIKRLCEHTAVDLKNSQQLVGAVYSLKETNKSLTEANNLMKQNRGVRTASATAITIEFGDLAGVILEKANDWGMDPSELVRDTIVRKYIENGWV